MMETLSVLYVWLKSTHVIFVIFWMAGLFMIPRFFVYHQESAEGSEEAAKWVDRESKLIKIILNPSIIVVWVWDYCSRIISARWRKDGFTPNYCLFWDCPPIMAGL